MLPATNIPDRWRATVVDVACGFFATEALPTHPEFLVRRVDALHTPVQYFRVSVAMADRDDIEVWVISAAPSSGRSKAQQFPIPTPLELDRLETALRADLPDALLCFSVADYEGYARVVAPGLHAPSIAAAVAAVKYFAGWDESDPIRVLVSPETYAVSIAHHAGAYHVEIRLSTSS